MKRTLAMLQRHRVQEMQGRERRDREIEKEKLESRVVKRIQRMSLDENRREVEEEEEEDNMTARLRAQVTKWRSNFDKAKRSTSVRNDHLGVTSLRRAVSDTSREVSNIITQNVTRTPVLWNVRNSVVRNIS